MKRFYTYNPQSKHPWVLRKLDNPILPCKHEIVDIGIYDLLKTSHHSKDKIKMWKETYTYGWKVVPDVPDMYGEFGHPLDYCNVEESKRLIEALYDPLDLSQMCVIQSKFEDYNSFVEYCEWFKELYGEPKKIALGSLCKINNTKVGSKMIKYAKRQFPKTWIHAFGIRLPLLKRVHEYVDSYDTMAWTIQGKRSATNNNERMEFLGDYIKKVENICGGLEW